LFCVTQLHHKLGTN